jgi:hypothetical protein
MKTYYVIEHDTRGFLCDITIDGPIFKWGVPAYHRQTLKYIGKENAEEVIRKYKLPKNKVRAMEVRDPEVIP